MAHKALLVVVVLSLAVILIAAAFSSPAPLSPNKVWESNLNSCTDEYLGYPSGHRRKPFGFPLNKEGDFRLPENLKPFLESLD